MNTITRVTLCLILAVSLIFPALAEYTDDCEPEPVYTADMPEFHHNEGNAQYLKRNYDLAIAS